MAAPQGIQGLFGGVGTPEEMQQQAIQAKATQFAQLTPDQQLGVMGYKGGANLGRGIAGAFGVEVQDPTIQRATRLRQLASQYNTNTAKGLREMAAAVRGMGDYESSDMLIKRAEEMEKNEVELGYKQAQTTKALTAKETSTASERNRKLIADAEVKLVEGKPLSNAELANLRWLVSQETKVKTFQDPDTREIVRIEPIDLSQAAPNLFKQLMTAPATLGGTEGAPTMAQGQQPATTATGTQPTGTFGGGKVTTIATPASEAKALAASEAKDTAIARLDEGLINIGQAMKLMESPTANPWISTWTENFPTDARALSNVVTSLKSQKTIDLINQMKNASKTGATGFGSVTEKELDLLQSDIVKLDQRSPTFKEDLKRLQTTWTNLQNKIKSSQAGGKTPQASSTAPNAALEAKIARFMQENKGKSREAVIEYMKKNGHYK